MYYQKTKWTSAKKSEYKGYIYDSGFEANHAAELDWLVKAKEIKAWERQKKIELIVNGYIVCNYYIDFVVHHNDSTIEYQETKGWMTEVWKIKWKLFEAIYSSHDNVKLTVIMQGKNKPPKARRVKKL